MKQVQKIIVGGDSFTAGDELDGDLHVPGYSSMLKGKVNDKKRKNAWKNYQKKLKELSNNDSARYDYIRKNCAWPAKLSKKIGIPVINTASPGASNQEISHRILLTVIRELNKGTTPAELCCLMMITHPLRFGSPISQDAEWSGEYNYETIHFHGLTDQRKEKQQFGKYVLTHYDYYDLFWHSYCHIQGLKSFLDAHNIPVIFFDSSLWSWGIKDQSTYYTEDERYGLTHFCGNIINSKFRLSDHNIKDHGLPGGHFVEEVHDFFANRLYEEVFDGI